jgi:hypothetical protein
MPKIDEKKKAREREIFESYLKIRGISYAEIIEQEPPDFIVKIDDSTQMHFELVELTDPNERELTGWWQGIKSKMSIIHAAELDYEFAAKFVEIFSDAKFEINASKTPNLMQNAYKRFLDEFKSEPMRFHNFVGDPLNNCEKTSFRNVLKISRTPGLTTKPVAVLSNLSYWVDENFVAFENKFQKEYADLPDLTILAFWKPRFLPGNRDGVRAQLEKIVHEQDNKSKISVVGFDLVNCEVFFEHAV